MFSNNIQSFIILTIYLLTIIDIILLIAIYYVIIKGRIEKKQYKHASILLKPTISAYIKDENKRTAVEKLLKNYFSKMVAIDIMIDYSKINNGNINEKFINLGFDAILIQKLQKKISIVYLKKLAFMRVESAYDTLLEFAQSEDLDVSYMSFFGLSLIELSKDKKENVIRKIIVSNIISDRTIEVLGQFNLKIEEWLELLEKEETIQGKVIFIKNIMAKEEIKNEKYSDRIETFLDDQREVKIAAILALSNSENEKYIDALAKVYENEESWQVRVAVAKGLSNFKYESVKDILLKMTKDSEWWVRYDAIKSIVAMGDDGLFSLIDLSLDVKDKNSSDLAYYFLNSNKDVYNTVKYFEV